MLCVFFFQFQCQLEQQATTGTVWLGLVLEGDVFPWAVPTWSQTICQPGMMQTAQDQGKSS